MACCMSLPYFVTSDRDDEQSTVNLEADDLLMYDSEDSDSVLRKWLTLFADTRRSGSDASRQDMSLCDMSSETCPLLNDCMWSAGMLPPDLKAATCTVRPSHDCVASEDTDLDSTVVCTAIDPSLISPCPHQPVTSSPGARHYRCTDTGDDDRFAAGDDDDDVSNDEVDVVSVPPSRSNLTATRQDRSTSRPERCSVTSGHASVSVVRQLLSLPPSCSLAARVTAMHNYSSCISSSSSVGGTGPRGGGVYSAPQSPSAPPRHRVERRCVSSPASPAPAPHHSTTTTVRRRGRRHRRPRRRPRVSSTWSSSASDSDCDVSSGHEHRVNQVGVRGGRRAYHNVLERRRRDHLKYSFETLRAVMPGTAADTRVPKVAILRRARDHVRQLTTTSQTLYAEYTRLMRLHERWTQKLALLTRHDHVDVDQRPLSPLSANDNLSTCLVQAAA